MTKFYLGMDIGTSSVGMACTDENYKLLRAKRKDLIATRLFEQANTAAERRTKRASRRRLMRRKQRIKWLQGIFAPYMADNTFFIRLNNSTFLPEDKEESAKAKYTLFNDVDFNEKDFYKKFPTIFHLRNHLLSSDKKEDLRLYYLALHHIIKYRGHFLFEGQGISDIHNFDLLAKQFEEVFASIFEEETFVIADTKAFKELAMDKTKKLNTKKKMVANLLGLSKADKQKHAMAELMLGASAKPSVLFDDEGLKEEKSFSFKGMTDEEFEAKCNDYADYAELLQSIKSVYDYFTFENILSGKDYISQSMVAIYDQHKKDLSLLKKFVIDNLPHTVYIKIFKATDQKCNYANYVGYTKKGGDKKKLKTCKREDFIKYLKKVLQENESVISDKTTCEYILNKLAEDEFLPKILHADNGLFPYQINKIEMDAILQKMQKNYPEFAVVDADGFSAVEKIQKIMTYKIPYYVGPINTAHKNKTKEGNGGNAWAEFKQQGKVTPWNFDQLIDRAKSNQNFMRRMTNKCTYLHDCDVLPKFSVIYQKYNVLNQINKIKLDGNQIDVQLEHDIFNDLFLKNKKVSIKNIKKYLVDKGVVPASQKDSVSLTGINDEINASMSSYVTLKNILGGIVDQKPELCEDIILWHTLNTDKSLVESLIMQKYGDLSQVAKNIKALKGINIFKEFGRLSKEFLCELSGGIDEITGEVYTILGLLYDTNQNLNEILYNNKYSFEQALQQANKQQDDVVDYDVVDKLYVSPQVKRGVWQALQMADEYVSAVGKAPDKIFIEVTRHNEDEKTKSKNSAKRLSRQKQLQNLYKDCKDIDDLIQKLNCKTDAQLRQERLYLYFMQLGRCMYSGEYINLDQLSGDMYDVDHIVPRSLVKDDSLDNKVLVLRTKNKQKQDVYPLPAGFTKAPQGFASMQAYWKMLKDKKLVSDKKYALLTRTNPLTNDDFNDFVNRQLVVTNQTAKAVAELLKIKYQKYGTKIIYSKASNVEDFKKEFDLTKCRETNDLHHARDAYLNVVVGNVYHSKFPWFYSKTQHDGKVKFNPKEMFTKDLAGAWKVGCTIDTVKNTLTKAKNIAVTRLATTGKGQFFDATVYGEVNGGGATVPLKEKAPYNKKDKKGGFKYGGYKSLSTAYFCIVQSKNKKGNTIKTIETIPVLAEQKINGDTTKLANYLSTRGLKEPKILVPKVKIKTLVSVNGFNAWIASGGIKDTRIVLHNAVQWFTDAQTDRYVNAILKVSQWDKDGKLTPEEKQQQEFKIKTNRFGKDSLVVNKQKNTELYNQIVNQMSLAIYSGINAIVDTKDKLVAHKNDFESLSVLDQIAVLLQCVQYLKCNAVTSLDLSKLKEGSSVGRTRISNDITNVDFKIINTSPCGLFIKEKQV
ncbi:MAG: type II CRISPR RNA-guided endonuclease Cas9 [Clostridia bacterium]|nr:type II CRISPR RNA-guided endonuclease Cas9 [Clostridia bacterium]